MYGLYKPKQQMELCSSIASKFIKTQRYPAQIFQKSLPCSFELLFIEMYSEGIDESRDTLNVRIGLV